MKKIPVVFVSDENYCVPTAVAIQSMLDNAHQDTFYEIYIIADGISNEYKRKLEKLKNNRSLISIIEVNDTHLSKYSQEGYYVSGTALLKFNIADLLPQYDKVLYIDGDILVCKDLTEIYDIDVCKYCLAAIPDMAAIDACHFDERLEVRNYFNSGVMLLNTKMIRKKQLCKKLYETKQKHPEYQCMDQDVFNDVFREAILFLPPKYNLMFYNFIIAKFTLKRVNEFYDTEYSSFEEMEKDAVIIHLTNEKKPWKFEDAYKSEEWMSYFVRTTFKEVNLNRIPKNIDRIVTRKGIFTKIWTMPVTTLKICGIPVVKKKRVGANVLFSVFGINIFRKETDGFTNRYYCLGIKYKKNLDFNYFVHRLNVYTELLRNGIDTVATKEIKFENVQGCRYGYPKELVDLQKQLLRLENMKEQEEGDNSNDESTI